MHMPSAQVLLQLLALLAVCSIPLAAQPASAQLVTPLNGTASTNSSTNSVLLNSSRAGSSAACCTKLQALGFSSNIPVMVVQLASLPQVPGLTADQAKLMAKGPSLAGQMCTCGAPPDGQDFDDLAVQLHVRGSSSAIEYAKKSFALTTLDQAHNLTTAEDYKVALLGFPQDSSWVLHGPENDRTLGMRNWLAYNMARRMGRYASRTRYFELLLNTDPGTPLSLDHYWGVYMLQEKVDRGKHRVDVAKLDPAADMSGGYMIAYENDNIEAKDPTLQTKLTGLTMILEYPSKPDDTTLLWITRWMNVFESTLLRQPLTNLSSVLDVPAAIDYWLGTEVTKNPDGYRGSIKMHKDTGGPLVMGPLWDYNEAFGMCCGYPIEGDRAGGRSNGTSGGSAISAAGWRFNICQDPGRCKVEPTDGISQWYRKMWQEAEFRTSAAARWQQLRTPGGPLTDDWFSGQITTLKQLLQEPSARNYQRWTQALNSPAYGPTYPSGQVMFDVETQLLHDWVLARLKWMDAALAAQTNATAGPDAYLAVGYVVAEPPNAGPALVAPTLPLAADAEQQAGLPGVAATGQPGVAAAQQATKPVGQHGR